MSNLKSVRKQEQFIPLYLYLEDIPPPPKKQIEENPQKSVVVIDIMGEEDSNLGFKV